MSEKKNPIEIKIETDRIKAGSPASIGLMVEVTAPEATATAITRQAQGIVFVVDRSGSMGGGRLELVKNSILETIGRVSKDDFLSVVAFDGQVQLVLPLTRVGNLDLREVRRTITNMQPGGNTNLELGYRHGLAEAAKAPNGVEVQVILLSDGQANNGETDPAVLGQLAAAATEHMISTSSLGIGEKYDEKILVALSNTGNGNHFAAVRLEEATLGLEDEINGLLERTVSNLSVRITTQGWIGRGRRTVKPAQPVRGIQHDPDAFVFNLGDLASGEERNFVFELKQNFQPGAMPGPYGEIGVEVFYFDSSGEHCSTGKGFELELVSEREWIEPARNEDIVMELAQLRAQDAKEQAINLMRAGREAEARELLERVGAGLEELEALSYAMSERNRARARANRLEFSELSMLQGEEFIKRGEESLKRGRESKPDPRKRNQGDI